jgi:hypothetical protein
VWQSGTLRGGRQRMATMQAPTNTVTTTWDPATTVRIAAHHNLW